MWGYMRINKVKSSFLKQFLILEIFIFMVLVLWYVHRLSTIDSIYVKVRLNEEIQKIQRDANDYFLNISTSLKKIPIYELKEYSNSEVSSEQFSLTHVKKVKWLGAMDPNNADLIRVSKGFCRVDKKLIELSLAKPGTLVLGAIDDCGSDVSAALSIVNKNGRYLGSFIVRLDLKPIMKLVDELMHISDHKQLSYAFFSNNGDIILSSHAHDDVAMRYLHNVINNEINKSSILPRVSMFGIGHNYYLKDVVISDDSYKIIVLINHKIAFLNSIHRLSLARADICLLMIVFIGIFLFVRYRFINPICNLSKAANEIDSGLNPVYIENYQTKELSDLANGLKSLISKQHQLMDSGNKLWFSLKQLEVIKRERVDFARNVQHILRTPVSHIIGGVEVLSSQFIHHLPPDGQEYLRLVGQSSENLLESINSIIKAADLRSGNVEINPDHCDIKRIIEEEVAVLLPKISQEKITLNMNIPSNLQKVYIDSRLFKTAIFNILDNAVKFNKINGIINISAKRTAIGMVISIEDSGIGMSSSQANLIKDLFKDKSASSNITSTIHGVGLGLAITHHVIDMHDAVLDIKSSEGFGTKVTISIPNIRIKQTKE